MLPFFPTPLPDELLYSVLARYHQRSWNLGHKITMLELYGENRRVSAEWPSYLNALCSNLSPDSLHTPQRFIDCQTLLPFYRPFFDPALVKRLVRYMLSGATNGFLMGIKSSLQRTGIPSWNRLRFCHACFEDEVARFGEPYWHRLHQLPGVLACPTHHQALHESAVLMPDTANAFIPLCRYHLQDSVPVIGDNHIDARDFTVAASARLLLESDLPCLGPGVLAKRYRAHLLALGHLTVNESLRREPLTTAFIEYHGEDFLERMGCSIRYVTHGKNWLDEFFWPHDAVNHPIRHILVMHFLGLTPHDLFFRQPPDYKPFGEGPWPCLNPVCPHYRQPVIRTVTLHEIEIGRPTGSFECESCGFVYKRRGPENDEKKHYTIGRVVRRGPLWEKAVAELSAQGLTVAEIARELDTTQTTVSRHLYDMTSRGQPSGSATPKLAEQEREAMRRAWVAAMIAHPCTSMSALGRMPEHVRVFNWLRKHDKAWLKENAPTDYDTGNMGISRVDWSKRDRQYASTIEEWCVRNQTKTDNPERFTRHLIIRRLGLNVNVLKNLDRLPLTATMLDRWVETPHEYRVRRIEIAARQLIAAGEPALPFHVACKAGIGFEPAPWMDVIEQAVAKAEMELRNVRE